MSTRLLSDITADDSLSDSSSTDWMMSESEDEEEEEEEEVVYQNLLQAVVTDNKWLIERLLHRFDIHTRLFMFKKIASQILINCVEAKTCFRFYSIWYDYYVPEQYDVEISSLLNFIATKQEIKKCKQIWRLLAKEKLPKKSKKISIIIGIDAIL